MGDSGTSQAEHSVVWNAGEKGRKRWTGAVCVTGQYMGAMLAPEGLEEGQVVKGAWNQGAGVAQTVVGASGGLHSWAGT